MAITLTEMKRGLVLIVGLSAVLASLPVLADTAVNDYQRGYADGIREGKNDVSWTGVLLGFFTGGISTIVELMLPGKEVPFSKLILLEGEPQAYKYGFMDGYKEGSRQQRIQYNLVGGAAMWILYLIESAAGILPAP